MKKKLNFLIEKRKLFFTKKNTLRQVDPAPGFKYKYSLYVDGKPLDQYSKRQAKILRIWEATINEKNYRVVLGNNKKGRERLLFLLKPKIFFAVFFFFEKKINEHSKRIFV